jgi:autotransporter-associated beta strand protein
VNGNSLDVQSSITGTAGFVKTGAGNMTLSTRQSYTGQTALSFGNLTLAGGRNTILVVPTLTTTVGNLQVNGGVFDLNGHDQAVGALLNSNTLAFAGGVITNSSGVAAVLSTATTTTSVFGANLTGNLGLTKSGTGGLTFPDVQSYTGPTIVRGGTLTLQDKGALLGTSSVTLNFGNLTFANNNLTTSADLNPVRLPASVPLTLRGATFTLTPGGSVDTTSVHDSVTVLGGTTTITASLLANAGARPQNTGGIATERQDTQCRESPL